MRTRPTKRKVLRRQAKATARYCGQVPLVAKREPLKELHVEGGFTEDGAVWKDELQRHCEEVHADNQETAERRRGS